MSSNTMHSKTYSYQSTAPLPSLNTLSLGKYTQYEKPYTKNIEITPNTQIPRQTPMYIPKLQTSLTQPDPLKTKIPIHYSIEKPLAPENRHLDASGNDRFEENKQDPFLLCQNKSQEFEEWICEDTERPNKKEDKIEISTEDSITLFSARNFNQKFSFQGSELCTQRDRMLMGSFVDTPRTIYVFQTNSKPRLW